MAFPRKMRDHGPGGMKCPAVLVVAAYTAPVGDGYPP